MNSFVQLVLISICVVIFLFFADKKTHFKSKLIDMLRKKLWLKILFIVAYIGICVGILIVDKSSNYRLLLPIALVLFGFVLYPNK